MTTDTERWEAAVERGEEARRVQRLELERQDAEWIKHDEKRMHLPELAGVCVECLQARVAELEAEVERLSWYEENYG